jgi:hypothetical protein
MKLKFDRKLPNKKINIKNIIQKHKCVHPNSEIVWYGCCGFVRNLGIKVTVKGVEKLKKSIHQVDNHYKKIQL